tara:strand:- start:356 stop:481 length:126 start_codon:yes stop_codon:yes gene_type:complete
MQFIENGPDIPDELLYLPTCGRFSPRYVTPISRDIVTRVSF